MEIRTKNYHKLIFSLLDIQIKRINKLFSIWNKEEVPAKTIFLFANKPTVWGWYESFLQVYNRVTTVSTCNVTQSLHKPTIVHKNKHCKIKRNFSEKFNSLTCAISQNDIFYLQRKDKKWAEHIESFIHMWNERYGLSTRRCVSVFPLYSRFV